MDEVAFITATRFSRKRVVTVSSDRIDFKMPIPAGTIVELIGSVAHIGKTSMKVAVEIFIEDMYSYGREKAITGPFFLLRLTSARDRCLSILEATGSEEYAPENRAV